LTELLAAARLFGARRVVNLEIDWRPRIAPIRKPRAGIRGYGRAPVDIDDRATATRDHGDRKQADPKHPPERHARTVASVESAREATAASAAVVVRQRFADPRGVYGLA